MSPRNYPLPRDEHGSDQRFTWGLIFDIGKMLTAAGYPSVIGDDHAALRNALDGFLYAGESPVDEAAAAEAVYADGTDSEDYIGPTGPGSSTPGSQT